MSALWIVPATLAALFLGTALFIYITVVFPARLRRHDWERHVQTTPGIRRITQFGCGCQWHSRRIGDAWVPCRQHADPASRQIEETLR